MLSDTNSIDGNQIPKEIIKAEEISNKVKNYDDYLSMVKDFYDEKVNYICLWKYRRRNKNFIYKRKKGKTRNENQWEID